MLDKTSVTTWLQAYVQAWKSYDEKAIGELFSEDAIYSDHPYHEPILGREAIVEFWIKDRDPQGTYDGHYELILMEGDRAVTHGRSFYYEEDGKTLITEFDNIFILRFDEQGRCAEYSEWYMERPKEDTN